MIFMFFLNCPYTLALRFGRVFAGWKVQLTRSSVFCLWEVMPTLVYLAVYSAQTIGIRWPRAMWGGYPSPSLMAADILTQHAPLIKIPCSGNLFCRWWELNPMPSACESDALTTWLNMICILLTAEITSAWKSLVLPGVKKNYPASWPHERRHDAIIVSHGPTKNKQI